MANEARLKTETGVCVSSRNFFVYFYAIFINLVVDCDCSQKCY